jgi:hypothetical protein
MSEMKDAFFQADVANNTLFFFLFEWPAHFNEGGY